jgi:hypothetical protein
MGCFSHVGCGDTTAFHNKGTGSSTEIDQQHRWFGLFGLDQDIKTAKERLSQ